MRKWAIFVYLSQCLAHSRLLFFMQARKCSLGLWGLKRAREKVTNQSRIGGSTTQCGEVGT